MESILPVCRSCNFEERDWTSTAKTDLINPYKDSTGFLAELGSEKGTGIFTNYPQFLASTKDLKK